MIDPAQGRSRSHRVFIVDDHPIVRRGLGELISDEPDMEVCGDAEDSKEALKKIAVLRPDIVIVDLTLKSGHGLELIQQIRAQNQKVKILVSSMHDELLFAERVLRAGAMGYISKQSSPDMIINAMRQVLRGEIYLSSRMANRLLNRVTGGGTLEQDPIQNLTDRELEVFQMIGRGLSTKQIAGQLGLSYKTIETHREKIKTKLNLNNSSELSRQATQWILEKGM
ncbi:MAG: response regulator transcription factor [Pirellulales bacterium]|nr:response regulator transcription factor [Pirellulales bacterium]